MELIKTSLGEISKNGRGYYGIGASAVPFSNDLYTYLRITDINDDGTLNTSDLKSVADSDARDYLLQPNDIVFARTGASTGRNYFYDGTDGELVYAGFLIKFSLDPQKVNPRFVKYYCQSKNYYDWISSFNTGSTRGNINAQTLASMPIYLPNRAYQDRVVAILDSLEEKRKINNRINDNLAEQSQAILGYFMEKYECTMKPLGDFADIIDCLHSKKPDSVTDTTNQLIQLNNILDTGFLDLTYKYYISDSDYANWTRKCEIIEGDCVITNVGRIGAVSQAPEGTHAAMGRNMTCIRLKPQYPYYSYLITGLLSSHIQTEIKKNTDEGTIMGALNVKNIPLLQFPFFGSETMTELESQLHSIRKSIEINYLSNQKLVMLRDALLPKLMSGVIDVSGISL